MPGAPVAQVQLAPGQPRWQTAVQAGQVARAVTRAPDARWSDPNVSTGGSGGSGGGGSKTGDALEVSGQRWSVAGGAAVVLDGRRRRIGGYGGAGGLGAQGSMSYRGRRGRRGGAPGDGHWRRQQSHWLVTTTRTTRVPAASVVRRYRRCGR